MGKDNSKKRLLELGSERVPNWECMFVIFLSENADDIKMAVKKQNMDPMCVARILDKNW